MTVYEHKSSRGYVSYQLRYFNGHKVVRFVRSKFDEVHSEAMSVAKNLSRGELDVLALKSDDRLSYVRSLTTLMPTGVSLEKAAEIFAEAFSLVGDSKLIVEAARTFSRSQKIISKPVDEIVDELLLHKRQNGRSAVYMQDLKLRLAKFSKAFKCPIASITTAQIEDYLSSLGVGGRTRNNVRRILGTLFEFAKKRDCLPKDHRGIKDVDRATEVHDDIQIFTPEELSKLLNVARPELIPFLALGAFAGIRHAEIKRLEWPDIDFAQGCIQVRASHSKTKIRRLIPMSNALREWLRPHVRESGPVVPFANMSKQLLWLAEKAGVIWRHNALRHSFISYRVAETQDIPKVAYEAGNSPRIIERNYLKRVMPAVAQSWFNVRPVSPNNIVSLPSTNVA